VSTRVYLRPRRSEIQIRTPATLRQAIDARIREVGSWEDHNLPLQDDSLSNRKRFDANTLQPPALDMMSPQHCAMREGGSSETESRSKMGVSSEATLDVYLYRASYRARLGGRCLYTWPSFSQIRPCLDAILAPPSLRLTLHHDVPCCTSPARRTRRGYHHWPDQLQHGKLSSLSISETLAWS
jgi:hypothetical protein